MKNRLIRARHVFAILAATLLLAAAGCSEDASETELTSGTSAGVEIDSAYTAGTAEGSTGAGAQLGGSISRG